MVVCPQRRLCRHCPGIRTLSNLSGVFIELQAQPSGPRSLLEICREAACLGLRKRYRGQLVGAVGSKPRCSQCHCQGGCWCHPWWQQAQSLCKISCPLFLGGQRHHSLWKWLGKLRHKDLLTSLNRLGRNWTRSRSLDGQPQPRLWHCWFCKPARVLGRRVLPGDGCSGYMTLSWSYLQCLRKGRQGDHPSSGFGGQRLELLQRGDVARDGPTEASMVGGIPVLLLALRDAGGMGKGDQFTGILWLSPGVISWPCCGRYLCCDPFPQLCTAQRGSRCHPPFLWQLPAEASKEPLVGLAWKGDGGPGRWVTFPGGTGYW